MKGKTEMTDYKKMKMVGKVLALGIGLFGTVLGTGVEIFATVKENQANGVEVTPDVAIKIAESVANEE